LFPFFSQCFSNSRPRAKNGPPSPKIVARESLLRLTKLAPGVFERPFLKFFFSDAATMKILLKTLLAMLEDGAFEVVMCGWPAVV